MRRALRLVLLAVLLLPLAHAGSGRQVVFVEEARTYEVSGDLVPGEARTLRFRVLEENVTRVAFHLAWEAPATLSLAVMDPEGHAPAPPAVASTGSAALSSGPLAPLPAPVSPEEVRSVRSVAGQGEWRAVVRAEEAAGRVPFTLLVVVTRFEPVTVQPVTLQGPTSLEAATADVGGVWSLLLLTLTLLACVLGVALVRRPRVPIPPGGGNTTSPPLEQGACAPRR